MEADRHDRVAALARAYARERLALIFTQGISKQFGRGWPDAKRVPSDADYVAALLQGRCVSRNVGCSLRASGLIGVEIDTQEGLDGFEALKPPVTWRVRSGGGGPGRHFYFRRCEGMQYHAFRIEAVGTTAEATRGLILPPSIHPTTGAEYAFEVGPLGVSERATAGIAAMPPEIYSALVKQAKATDVAVEEAVNVGIRIPEGARRRVLHRFICALMRWGLDEIELLYAANRWNERRNDPPLSEAEVAHQVAGIVRRPKYQPSRGASLAAALENAAEADALRARLGMGPCDG
jgi:hypothetical protein